MSEQISRVQWSRLKCFFMISLNIISRNFFSLMKRINHLWINVSMWWYKVWNCELVLYKLNSILWLIVNCRVLRMHEIGSFNRIFSSLDWTKWLWSHLNNSIYQFNGTHCTFQLIPMKWRFTGKTLNKVNLIMKA